MQRNLEQTAHWLGRRRLSYAKKIKSDRLFEAPRHSIEFPNQAWNNAVRRSINALLWSAEYDGECKTIEEWLELRKRPASAFLSPAPKFRRRSDGQIEIYDEEPLRPLTWRDALWQWPETAEGRAVFHDWGQEVGWPGWPGID